MKSWYRIWKKSGHHLDEHYTFTEEQFIKEKTDEFSERASGGEIYGYRCGWERIESPPLKWIKKQIVRLQHQIELRNTKIRLLREELQNHSLDDAFN